MACKLVVIASLLCDSVHCWIVVRLTADVLHTGDNVSLIAENFVMLVVYVLQLILKLIESYFICASIQ